jgi:RHS repeat-associated protein
MNSWVGVLPVSGPQAGTLAAAWAILRKQQYNGGSLITTTDYIDGFVYLTAGAGSAALSYFPMPEGRVLVSGSTYTQQFIITDQQGNARIAFQNNGSGTAVVTQENSYYGLGLIMPNSPVSTPTTPNKRLYNGGSEWQNDYSNLPDYYMTNNRNYDAAIGRFIGVDPMAESAESMSSYQYAGNNPIMFNDPNGDLAGDIVNGRAQLYNAQQDFDDWINEQGIGGGGRGGSYGYGGRGGKGKDLYDYDPDAYEAINESTGGTLGGTSIYNATNQTGSMKNAISATIESTGYLLGSLAGVHYSMAGDYLHYDYLTILAAPAVDGSYGGANVVNHSGNIDVGGGMGSMESRFTVDADVTLNGAFLILNFNSTGLHYKSYNYIQTVSSSGEFNKDHHLNLPNPHVDGARGLFGYTINYPFYNGYPLDDGTGIIPTYFGDSPYGEQWFTAQVTLVGINYNGTITPLGSYNWGYVMSQTYGPLLVNPRFSPTPSKFQQGIINKYNSRFK